MRKYEEKFRSKKSQDSFPGRARSLQRDCRAEIFRRARADAALPFVRRGVQGGVSAARLARRGAAGKFGGRNYSPQLRPARAPFAGHRSEERRVGKEGRSRWSP